MSRSSSTSISPHAYLKLLLHSAKYQSRAVVGALIAHEGESSQDGLRIRDCVPLFHTIPLVGSIELALSQLDTWLQQTRPGAFLAGVYYAPELYQPTVERGEVALPMPQANPIIKMAERIKDNGKGAAGTRIFLLDHVHLGALGSPESASTHSALHCFESSSSSARGASAWSNTGSVTVESAHAAQDSESGVEFAVGALKRMMREEQQRQICDFDDHLDDCKADWTNAELEKSILPTAAAAHK